MLTKRKPLSSEEKKHFIRAGKCILGLTKEALLFMSGFIQAEPMWE